MASVFEINKGINRSIVFKGVKAQYILYLAMAVLLLLVLFAILYFLGCNIYLLLAIVIPLGAFVISYIQNMSRTYGEFGLTKKLARQRLPAIISSHSHTLFTRLIISTHEKDHA
jgi:ABC-type multidrug transport system fused ATPase/permease subunit